jgi:hypothetical protein
MRLGWWSRLKFEPRRHRMAINHRPLSGQLLPLAHPTKPSFERLVYSETCRMPYGSISAFADIKVQARVRQLLVAFLTFVPWQPACQVPPHAYACFRPWAAFRLAVRQKAASEAHRTCQWAIGICGQSGVRACLACAI